MASATVTIWSSGIVAARTWRSASARTFHGVHEERSASTVLTTRIIAVERDDSKRLLRAPLNAVGAPPGKDRKLGRPGAGRLVLARLVWENRTSIVPAVAVWFSSDRTCVEWRSHPGSPTRMTWLPRSDVRPYLLYPNR